MQAQHESSPHRCLVDPKAYDAISGFVERFERLMVLLSATEGELPTGSLNLRSWIRAEIANRMGPIPTPALAL